MTVRVGDGRRHPLVRHHPKERCNSYRTVRGPGFDYNHKQFRRSERDLVEQHERAYEVMITNWKPHRLDPGG